MRTFRLHVAVEQALFDENRVYMMLVTFCGGPDAPTCTMPNTLGVLYNRIFCCKTRIPTAWTAGVFSVHLFHKHHGLLVHLETLHLHAVVKARHDAHLLYKCPKTDKTMRTFLKTLLDTPDNLCKIDMSVS